MRLFGVTSEISFELRYVGNHEKGFSAATLLKELNKSLHSLRCSLADLFSFFLKALANKGYTFVGRSIPCNFS